MRRFLASLACITLGLVVMFSTVRAICGGTRNPTVVLLLASGDCRQPCWHGIQPGITSAQSSLVLLREAAILPAAGTWPSYYNAVCWSSTAVMRIEGCVRRKAYVSPALPIKAIELKPRSGAIHLNDMIQIFGAPVAFAACRIPLDSPSPLDTPSSVVVDALFNGNVYVRAYNARLFNPRTLDPGMVVARIVYYAPGDPPGEIARYQRWDGLSSLINPHPCLI